MATSSHTLSIKCFEPPSNGDTIDCELRKSATNVITQNIENSVKFLMGNNKTVTDIPMAINLLLQRNYPTLFDENGRKIIEEDLIQISVPDIILSRSTKFVGPPPNMTVSVNPKILKEETKKENLGKATVTEKDMENQSSIQTVRHKTIREMLNSRGALKGYVGNFFGEKVEANVYSNLRNIFQENREEYGIFHSLDLYDFGLLQRRSCCIHLKVKLKDPTLPPSLDGKYTLSIYNKIWFHENGIWVIYYNPNGWMIAQKQKQVVSDKIMVRDVTISGLRSKNVQCPHKILKWCAGNEIVKVNVEKISDFREKDLIIVNKKRRCVLMVSCKRNLSMTDFNNPMKDSEDQLNDGWDRFKKWFGSRSNKRNWKFIPLIYYENGSCPDEYSSLEDFIIKGNVLFYLS